MGFFKKHKAKQEKLVPLEVYEENEIQELEAYIQKTFGSFENVFHEIFSPDIHVDIAIIAPNETDPYYKLVTMGMGAHDMEVPSQFAAYELRNAELLIYLPADWNIKSNDENDYWPLRWLKIIARMPIDYHTWVGYGHTIAAGSDRATLSDNNQFEGIGLIEALEAEKKPACVRLSSGKLIRFYQLLPLYGEEMEYKLHCQDMEALLAKFDDDFSLVVDIHRKNYGKL